MPMWLWGRYGSVFDLEAYVAAELARALMGWTGPLSALSFSMKGASWSMLLDAGKAPVDFQRSKSVLGRSLLSPSGSS
ncbi:hypothetical protein BHE74_00044452 [Ensete ventricosum]|nr:hypothetical protein BHE74_00044452 [Ensete ventricosum]